MSDPQVMGGGGTVLIYERDTNRTKMRYPTVWAERVRRTSLSTWERRVVIGGPDSDSDEFISSWDQDDYSGGFGIEDANEGTDVARVRFAFADARSPKHLTHAPKTLKPAKPSWASGTCTPLGDVMVSDTDPTSRFYMAWGSHASGWIEGTTSYSATDNSLGMTPVDTGTTFGGWLFVPCGASGFVALRQSSDATQTLNIQSNSTIKALAFGTWNNQLYCIDTTNRLWQLTQLGIETSPITVTSTTWAKVSAPLTSTTGDLILDRSHTPRKLIAYFNREGKEVLWCITNRGAFMLLFDAPEWIQTTLKPSMHPDFGKGAVTWRSGEDLWIPAGGLDITRFTPGFVEVPLSGPGKDQGVPPEYAGTIYDLEAERSTLYALVRSFPTTTTDTLGDMGGAGSETATSSTTSVAMWLAAWTGTSWCCLSRDTDSTGEPTKLFISTGTGSYRLHWGGTDSQARSQLIPMGFYNPRSKLVLGRDPFELTAEWETFRYDAAMTGWDKIASHAFAMADFASPSQYIDVYYRTDQNNTGASNPLDEPEYVLWKRIDTAGRTILWFDDEDLDDRSGLPWREGLPFQWIQFKFISNTSDELKAMIWGSFSLHHIRVPQDAASYVIKIPFYDEPTAKGMGLRSGKEMARTLREMQRLRKFIHLQVNNYEVFRGRIVGIAEEAWAGGENFSSVMVVNFVEIGSSSNANTVTA